MFILSQDLCPIRLKATQMHRTNLAPIPWEVILKAINLLILKAVIHKEIKVLILQEAILPTLKLLIHRAHMLLLARRQFPPLMHLPNSCILINSDS